MMVLTSTRTVSIHASHAGGDLDESYNDHWYHVSIHASHAGGDSIRRGGADHRNSFNPRLPCGRRRAITELNQLRYVFQSTPPMREATPC